MLVYNLVINLSLISNKAPNLYSVICFEMNTISITTVCKMKRVAISSFSLSMKIVTIYYGKQFCSLSCKPIYGLLSYWQGINCHSQTYEG